MQKVSLKQQLSVSFDSALLHLLPSPVLLIRNQIMQDQTGCLYKMVMYPTVCMNTEVEVVGYGQLLHSFSSQASQDKYNSAILRK